MSERQGSRDSTPTATSRSRVRSTAAIVCLVVAALLTTPAVFAYWGQRTVNDTHRYVATVQPLVDSPEVQSVVAAKVSDAIEQQVDVAGVLDQVFAGVTTDRPRLHKLVGPLSGAINAWIDSLVKQFVASAAFADLWVTVNTKAQQSLVRVLKGGSSEAISVQGDQVVLDLNPVIDQVKTRLAAHGLTVPDNAAAPTSATQIVLLDAPQLKQMQRIYALATPVARWLILVVALLYLAGYLLARRRPRMTVAIGLALTANALLAALLLAVGRHLFVNHLAGTVFAPASRVFYNTLLTYLLRSQRVMLLLGLVLIAAGWFAGRNRLGTAARTRTTEGLDSLGAALTDTKVPAGAGSWVATHLRWLQVVVGVLGVVVLVWGNDISERRFLWSLILVLLLLACLEVLAGAGRAVDTQHVTATPPGRKVHSDN